MGRPYKYENAVTLLPMSTEQREFFDALAARWDSMEHADIRERLDRVVREAGVAHGMRVLDVGSGTGVLIPSLLDAMRGGGEVHAIDISDGMLGIARAKGFPANVSLIQADLLEYRPAGGLFDRVMCNAVFPHFTDKDQALRQAYSLLHPGGWLAVSHPTGRAAVNKVHAESSSVVSQDRVPDATAMRALLQAAGFDSVSVTDEPEFYLAQGRKP
jgi:ubiquinone/menaquinone biosynthesis C-methylase UbiE